jgi:hypothetical protein
MQPLNTVSRQLLLLNLNQSINSVQVLHQLLLSQEGTRDPGDRTAMNLALLNKGRDLITGETTTIMKQMILDTKMVKLEAEGQGVSMERERMALIMLQHLETDQEGIITMSKSQLRPKYLIIKH